MRILVTDGMADVAVETLRETGFEVDVHTAVAAKELLRIIARYDVLCVRSATQVTADIIAAAPDLKVIGRAGKGLDNIDLRRAAAARIKVFNTPSATAESVAELAIGLMLTVSRFIAEADATMKAGRWEKKRMVGTELGGKTLGVVGTGAIGCAVMTRARALGMEVIATKRDLGAVSEAVQSLKVPIVPLDELLRGSDYISVHLPLTKHTRDLIDATAINKMKDGVFLINCARGGVVNESALADAVRRGKVAGAGVDVYATEPPRENPFAGLSRVVQTPHLGASTREGQIRASMQLAQQIIAEFNE